MRQYFTSAEREEALRSIPRADPPRQDLPRVDYSPTPKRPAAAPRSFREWMADQGLTNRQAAERCGVSIATIGNWKRGRGPKWITKGRSKTPVPSDMLEPSENKAERCG